MKSIISIGLGILITASIFSGIPLSHHENNKVIRLICKDPHPDESSLKQSASIIQKRLEDSGLQILNVDISDSGISISIPLNNNIPVEKVREIATAKGELAFYETVSEQDAISQIKSRSQLATLLQPGTQEAQSLNNYPGTIVGKCKASDTDRVDEILAGTKKIGPDPACFMWSAFPDESGLYTLYLLKDEPMLSGKYIDNSKVSESAGEPESILVNFSDEGAKQWEALTRKNINRPLALVMDERVIFAPLVRDAIKGGKCMITGSFSREEAERINVLIKYGELPLAFEWNE